ncbi:MAG: hypothetical protein CVU55_14155 [Deltaproteobacteria bacterium HGW-Deltaproteobacteria-13]|jgi:uncharacterized membrane protein HdeD (DUF308 family)|nr:MAG: hypothetical protein CVU55_14155 [Deltaproteobacteria bacterium HGW-Deltaproteobacteria-13]
MKDILILVFDIFYLLFGIVILIHPKWGAKFIEALPMGDAGIIPGIFKSKSLTKEQKKVRPSIIRLLGITCIIIGLWILVYKI